MIGVGQDGLCTEATHHLRSQCLHVRLRAHGNERRGADHAMRGVDDAGAPEAAFGTQASADLEPAVGAVGSRRGRGWERRDLFGGGGAEPVSVH